MLRNRSGRHWAAVATRTCAGNGSQTGNSAHSALVGREAVAVDMWTVIFNSQSIGAKGEIIIVSAEFRPPPKIATTGLSLVVLNKL